jgi:hypothetical protein
MAIRTSGTNSYIHLTVKAVTDGENAKKIQQRYCFAVQIQPTAQLRW